MKVLDLFCGLGGWSKPFVDDGDEVLGIDILDFSYAYPGKFTRGDICEFHPSKGLDCVLGSPPCRDFSVAGRFGNG